jgi:hydrogenase/urease accessory protein HupE
LPPSEAIVGVESGGLHTTQEMQLTFTIMGFGLVALLFLYLMSRQRHIPPFVLRVYVITIIIFGTLAVVASAYTNDQIAPVVGLFGTIAGYVLGRTDRPADPLTDTGGSGGASRRDAAQGAGESG